MTSTAPIAERATRYPELTVAGSPTTMGEQIGEALREYVRGFDAIALQRVQKTMDVSRERAEEVARRCIDDTRSYAPHMVEELEGVERASGVPLDRLMLLQIRNQLQPDVGEGRGMAPAADSGCTAFALGAEATGSGGVAGQNWDNDPAMDPFTVVLTRRPEDAPAFMSVTQAGLIAYLGVSDAGIGLCMNTLPAPARRYGVPHYFTVRGIYEARSLDEAVRAVRRAQRAIPANVLLATPQGPADLEITADDVHVLRDDDGAVTHTNHCVHPDLAPINDDFPELIQSGPRKCRVDELLTAAPRPVTRESLQAILSDHQDHPCSICRHANEHPTTGYWTSVWSLIVEVDAGRLHLTRGNPCQQPYETYEMN
jgi:isopenicillin-N N-acyltransferase-like protein